MCVHDSIFQMSPYIVQYVQHLYVIIYWMYNKYGLSTRGLQKLSAAVFAGLKGFHQKGFLIDKKERMEAELEFLNSVWGIGTE